MYTVKELARLTGLTPRTLRYYDSIGLLCPRRNGDNDYRLNGSGEVERLQQILLYREMGLPLEEIGRILDAPDFDRAGALRGHLDRLLERRRETEALIRTVRRELQTMEGEQTMQDKDKFEGMKRRIIQENEAAYGQEAREKYGAAVSDSAARLAGMTEGEWTQMQEEERGYRQALLRAMAADDPAGEDAREAVRLHAAWLARYWPPESVTAQAHLGMAELYVQDRRFTEHYEKTAPGFAAFFLRAVQAYYREP